MPEDTHAQQRQVHVQQLAHIFWQMVRIPSPSLQKSGSMRNPFFWRLKRALIGGLVEARAVATRISSSTARASSHSRAKDYS